MIHFQKTATSQRDRAVVALQQTFMFQLFVNWLEFLPNVNAKLLKKITGIKLSGL